MEDGSKKQAAVVPVENTGNANGGGGSAGGSQSDGVKEPTPSTSAENVVDGQQVQDRPTGAGQEAQVEV